jgi:kynureninase
VAGPVRLDDLTRSPNALAPHYSRFGVTERLLLSGHSHQAWPDVALDGLVESFTSAAAEVDGKWSRADEAADVVRAGYRRLLGDPDGEIALGPATHDLVVKLLSCLDLPARPRLVVTAGEFHSLRRQADRLAQVGLEVVRVPLEPLGTLTARMAAEVDDRTALVGISAVLFTDSRIVAHLDALVPACERHGADLLVDAYHALGPLPFPIHELGLDRAWVTGGGYKYLQLGEGNAFLRIPPHRHDARPVITGWFAEFDDLTGHHEPHAVTFGPPSTRFAGGTYDPASHHRAGRVLEFFEAHGLEPAFLRTVYQHQLRVLADAVDALDLPPAVLARDRDIPVDGLAGFLSLRAPDAGRLQQELRARGVFTDSRADRLRVGPAPYLSDAQLTEAIAVLGDVAGRPR